MSSLRSLAKAVAPAPLLRKISEIRDWQALPDSVKAFARADRRGLPEIDPGPAQAIDAAMRWLSDAQDHSTTQDGGVARHFSLLSGWGASYPETTGYIVPTFLSEGRLSPEKDYTERARRMLDWLVSIQMPGGGFQGGMVDQEPKVPVTFNTGQILLGLAAGAKEFDSTPYRDAAMEAAQWLTESLDADGCWRKHPTPFANPGEKAYETHVSWGLFEADPLDPSAGFGVAGLRQVDWALTKQRSNGWFDACCLSFPDRPLTHTIGYVLRGIVEAYRFSDDPKYLASARSGGEALLGCLGPDGYLPGRLDSQWKAAEDSACLTGSVQIAAVWLDLFEWTGDERFLSAGRATTRYVRRTLSSDGPMGIRGAVRGSFPVEGGYGTYEFLNWAAKFFVDANRRVIELENA